jgi:hypothetical protein
MVTLTRRFIPLLVAAIGGFLVITPTSASAAGLGTATADPASFANTVTAQKVTVTTSVPSSLFLGGASIQLKGPGKGADAYTGTGTAAATGGSGSFTTTFNLVTAAGLPAGPGTYALNANAFGSLTLASGTVTITGAAPAPNAVTSPLAVAAGGNTAVTIPGKGFAKDESLSIARPGGAATDVTFTENNTTSTATSLAGTLAVGAAVPAGVYDVKITDSAGQVGICRSCLQVTSGTATGPGPVGGLTATPTSANTATVSWNAPTTGTTATSYSVVVSTTSATTTDTGVTVTVDSSTRSATVTGLKGTTTYFVAVRASDGTNTGPPATTELDTPNPSALSLQASHTSVVAGKQVKLSGLLVHSVGTNPASPLAGQQVVIAARSDTGKTTTVATVTTKSNGTYSFLIFPKTDAAYGAFYSGSNGGAGGVPDAPAASNAFPKVMVAPLVVAAARHTTLTKHAKVTVHGTITPNESGRTVRLVRIDGTGKTHRVGSATLSAGSHFTITGRIPTTRGVYSLRALIGPRVGNVAGESAIIRVHRK